MDRDPPARYGDALASVVVTRPGGPAAHEALASARAATDRTLHELVVHSGAVLPPGVEPGAAALAVGEDAGRGAAVNRAVAGLPSDVGWVALADPDVRWPVGAIDALLAVAGLFPRAGVVGAALRCGPGHAGRVGDAAGALPRPSDLVRGRVPVRGPASPGPGGWVSGRALLLRRTAWDSVDGYDPRHLGPLDDVDLGDRLGRSGWLVVHVPTVEVGVGPSSARGMLESPDRGIARYADDRFGVAVRTAVRLTGWTRARVRGAGPTPAPGRAITRAARAARPTARATSEETA